MRLILTRFKYMSSRVVIPPVTECPPHLVMAGAAPGRLSRLEFYDSLTT